MKTLLSRLRHWYCEDRVRVAATTGKQFRLERGQVVLLDDQLWIVQKRREITSADRLGVQYQLSPFARPAGDFVASLKPLWLEGLDFDVCMVEGETLKLEAYL